MPSASQHCTAAIPLQPSSSCNANVKANLRVAQRTKKKQGWEALLGQLTQLREASHLHDKLK